MVTFKIVWLAGMVVTAVLIALALVIFNRPPIKEDLVVIAIWPYFLCYFIGFVSVGLYAFFKDRKKVNKS